MVILVQIAAKVFIATVATRLQESKTQFIYVSRTANIILLSYIYF